MLTQMGVTHSGGAGVSALRRKDVRYSCGISRFTPSQLAAGNCVAPIVDCIRKMRSEGLADNEIAGLFRHAADELDETTTSATEEN